MAPASLFGIKTGGPELMASVWRFWNKSYASDYVGLTFIMSLYLFIQFLVEPFHHMFFLNDLRISFPHAEVERVPIAHALLYSLLVPLVLLLLTNSLTSAPAHKHHLSVLGLAVAAALSALLVDVVKNAAGRPRPDLLARCRPAAGTARDALVSVAVCTETRRHLLHDGWRAFPSGHTALAFAGLGYLSLWLAGQTRIFAHGPPSGGSGGGVLSSLSSWSPLRSPGAEEDDAAEADRDGPNQDRGRGRGRDEHQHPEKLVRADLLSALLCLAPLVGAAMIGISRLQDYRHDVFDVCAGGAVGWTVGYWSYRRYWPRLGSARCAEPHGTVAGGGAGGQGKETGPRYDRLRDEEEGGGRNVRTDIEMSEWRRERR